MKTQGIILILFSLPFIFSACKKNDTSAPIPGARHKGTVTEQGTPVGNAVSKEIDSKGGTIASADGNITVTIPANAVSSNTTFSIQPITNKTPNGLGLGYRLLPEGSHFNKPVTITFHYTDSLIHGTLPSLLYVAYQDKSGVWLSAKNADVNTGEKTISVSSSHFSDWATFASYILVPEDTDILPNDIDQLTVKEIFFLSDLNGEAFSPIDTSVTEKKVVQWNLLYKEGMLYPSANAPTAKFVAPAQVPAHNPVVISAEVHNIKNNEGSNGTVILFANINVTSQLMTISIDGSWKTYTECRLFAKDGVTVIHAGPNKDTLAAVITLAGQAPGSYDFNIANNKVVVTDGTKGYASFYGDCNSGLVSTMGTIKISNWADTGRLISGEISGQLATGTRCNYQMKNLSIRFKALHVDPKLQ